ncbi:hypothetical protein F9C07_2284569 [Aspergillus flavus]|uniref:Uncharacterized protein n=1 Tax=Aspergillus flavus (strain ATCC 200026 / FGSC A1120 / IAM 13836 / NRRL 3357 / JCM 12722 / SRRC 167) TaxID=332952 RepID=A0A7U2QTF3_ASPFN|nr:hypothetical protein F9C07_2284569 [Aspergillus flavus]
MAWPCSVPCTNLVGRSCLRHSWGHNAECSCSDSRVEAILLQLPAIKVKR